MPVSGPARGILRGLAGVDDRTGLVVVPPIGVVVGDDDRCEVPLHRPLQRVDGVDEEMLIERIGSSRRDRPETWRP